jgi:hypothetical protein
LEKIRVIYRLRNEKNLGKCLWLTKQTWIGIVNLAETFGWNPMGNGYANNWLGSDPYLAGVFLGRPLLKQEQGEIRSWQITLEDALNLADALEMAFLSFEPQKVPSLYFYFETDNPGGDIYPSLGAIQLMTDFCRQGAFMVEIQASGDKY